MTIHRDNFRYLLAALLIGALVLCIGTLVLFSVPNANRELLAAAAGALVMLCQRATQWVFPSRDEKPPPGG